MENKIMISVIVPIYNSRKYLSTCISSVLKQTFLALELLLIDDGSTDDSLSICKEWEYKDQRVRVLHKENSGVSETRNIGMQEAKGEYLIFLDADDFWLQNNCLEQLLHAAVKNNVDLVRGDYISVNSFGEKKYSKKKSIKYLKLMLPVDLFLKEVVCGEYFSWLFLIRRKIIVDNNVKFPPGKIYLEDMQFLVELFAKSPTCLFLNLPFYAYRKHEISVSSLVSIKKLADSFDMCDVYDKWAMHTKNIDLRDYYRKCSVLIYCLTLNSLAQDPYFSKHDQLLQELFVEDRRKRILDRKAEYRTKSFSLILNLPPIFGIFILRFRNNIMRFMYLCSYKVRRIID